MANCQAASLDLVAGERVLGVQEARVSQPFDRPPALSEAEKRVEVVLRGAGPEVARQAPLRDLRDLYLSVHSHIIAQAARD